DVKLNGGDKFTFGLTGAALWQTAKITSISPTPLGVGNIALTLTPVTLSGKGSLSVSAAAGGSNISTTINQGIYLLNGLNVGGNGAITVNPGANIQTQGNDLTLTGGSVTINGATLDATTLTGTGGNISITGTSNNGASDGVGLY